MTSIGIVITIKGNEKKFNPFSGFVTKTLQKYMHYKQRATSTAGRAGTIATKEIILVDSTKCH